MNGGITINVDVTVKKYLAKIMDDSTIICDEIINAKETNFN